MGYRRYLLTEDVPDDPNMVGQWGDPCGCSEPTDDDPSPEPCYRHGGPA